MICLKISATVLKGSFMIFLFFNQSSLKLFLRGRVFLSHDSQTFQVTLLNWAQFPWNYRDVLLIFTVTICCWNHCDIFWHVCYDSWRNTENIAFAFSEVNIGCEKFRGPCKRKKCSLILFTAFYSNKVFSWIPFS